MASSSKNSAAGANKILGKRGPEDVLENKPVLKRHTEKSKDDKETTEGFADIIQQIKRRIELKSDQANLISVKEAVDGIDEPSNFVEEVAERKKTLFLYGFSRQTKISYIIDFFHDVGEVVRVKLVVRRRGSARLGVVEFSSANEAKKALEKKNGEYLCGHNTILRVINNRPHPSRRTK